MSDLTPKTPKSSKSNKRKTSTKKNRKSDNDKKKSHNKKSSSQKSSTTKPIPSQQYKTYSILVNPNTGEKELFPISILSQKNETIDTRTTDGNESTKTVTNYYVHYTSFDNRMDRWISSNDVITKDQLLLLKHKYKLGNIDRPTGLDRSASVNIDNNLKLRSVMTRSNSVNIDNDLRINVDGVVEANSDLILSPQPMKTIKSNSSYADLNISKIDRTINSSPSMLLDSKIPSSSPLGNKLSINVDLPSKFSDNPNPSPRPFPNTPVPTPSFTLLNKGFGSNKDMIRLSSPLPSPSPPPGPSPSPTPRLLRQSSSQYKTKSKSGISSSQEDDNEDEQFIMANMGEDEIEKLNVIAASNLEELDNEFDGEDESMKHSGELIKLRNINKIIINKFEISCWYFSPYPVQSYTSSKATLITTPINPITNPLGSNLMPPPAEKNTKTDSNKTNNASATQNSTQVEIIDTLYICDFCLNFYQTEAEYKRHFRHCTMRTPPGNEIYRYQNNSLFEIDGAKEIAYAQNLCLLSKLFLEHKSCYWDTIFFLFYVLTEIDENGAHIVGYFSKAKHSAQGNNLACILVIPCYQRKGYGTTLIDMSYSLSLVEHKNGTPERPLSDLGKVSFSFYWLEKLVFLLSKSKTDTSISIDYISHLTGMAYDDIIDTLTQSKILKYHNYEYFIDLSPSVINNLPKTFKNINKVKMDNLHFVPYIPTKRRKVN